MLSRLHFGQNRGNAFSSVSGKSCKRVFAPHLGFIGVMVNLAGIQVALVNSSGNLGSILNSRNFYPIQALKSSRLIQYYANTARNSLLEIESSQNSHTKIVWLFNTYFAFQIHRKSYKYHSNSRLLRTYSPISLALVNSSGNLGFVQFSRSRRYVRRSCPRFFRFPGR